MQLVLSNQQWLGGILAAAVALVVYAAGVRSSRASQRYEKLTDAGVRLSEAAVRLASRVSAAETAERPAQDPGGTDPLRPLHEEVRAAAAAVSFATRSRQVRLLSAVIVRTSWQMRHQASHPDEPRERWPWWRFEAERPHPDARRCPGCPVGVRPPVAIMAARARGATTVRLMNQLLDELQFAVATEVARSPYSLGQGARRLLAWILDRTPGHRRAHRPRTVSRRESLLAWWEQLPDLLRHRGVPRRDELDEWLRHYGFLGFGDPKP